MEKFNIPLGHKSCVPCQGGTPSLTLEEVEKLLPELGNGWSLNDVGHLCKEYLFKNFIESMSFANKVTKIAEKEANHPNLKISWGICGIEIWTHKINALTESDFILAAKIESIK